MTNNLNNSLPELLERATDTLDPQTDLVARGISRGTTLRRRRTVLRAATSVTAVAATVAAVAAGTQLFGGSKTQAPVAGKPNPVATATPVVVNATKADTLADLRAALPPGLKVVKTELGGDNVDNTVRAVVDDGHGQALVLVLVTAPNAGFQPSTPVVRRPDGSKLGSLRNQPVTPGAGGNPGGVVYNVVDTVRPGGQVISLMAFNAPEEKGATKTRPAPVLSVAQLTKIADSKIWTFPAPGKPGPKPTGKPQPLPGEGKPAVPLQQTQQTLRKVLPHGLKLTRPEVWGGGHDGFNAVAYVVDDGKGLSRVLAFVTIERPVTKCQPERSTTHCEVKADGSVVGWSKNAPTYSDARQQINGVVANIVEIHYPDGRYINMYSFNGPQEKDAKHTRPAPPFTTDKLLEMAKNKGWKFPGNGN
ncbi:hypothetical protein AB0E69_34220 [Kribbella sp. NPDC026611]|uniref:hypothetical protein n=1 Tax=Kribbella sp. NPDC026611 TaxID=3154911 RepID=UPI0033CB7CED